MTVIATAAFQGSLDPDRNLAAILADIDAAAQAGADLLVFPECALQGYPSTSRRESREGLLATWADAEDVLEGPRATRIAARCVELGIHVVYGLTERTRVGGVVYNTAVLTGPTGHIGSYRKVHLGIQEQKVWRRGSQWPVFETSFGRIGMLICVDKAWPEATRELTLGGADLLVMPTAWPFEVPGREDQTAAWRDYYLGFERVRAMENSRWFISSNFVGEIAGERYPGYSQIIDPHGRVVASSEGRPGLVIAEIDVQAGIAEAHATWFGPRTVRERRDDTYRILRGELPIQVDG